MKRKTTQVELQARINEAAVVDLEILKQYQGKEVLMELEGESGSYQVVYNKAGIDFLPLTQCKYHYLDFKSMLEDYVEHVSCEEKNPNLCTRLPDFVVSRSSIENIALVDDLIKHSKK